MIHIPKADFRDSSGVVVTYFSGISKTDPGRDRDEIYGSVDDVLAVMRAIDEKGKGLSLVWNDGNSEQVKPIAIRNASLGSKLIWAHVLEL